MLYRLLCFLLTRHIWLFPVADYVNGELFGGGGGGGGGGGWGFIQPPPPPPPEQKKKSKQTFDRYQNTSISIGNSQQCPELNKLLYLNCWWYLVFLCYRLYIFAKFCFGTMNHLLSMPRDWDLQFETQLVHHHKSFAWIYLAKTPMTIRIFFIYPIVFWWPYLLTVFCPFSGTTDLWSYIMPIDR